MYVRKAARDSEMQLDDIRLEILYEVFLYFKRVASRL